MLELRVRLYKGNAVFFTTMAYGTHREIGKYAYAVAKQYKAETVEINGKMYFL